MYTLNKEYNTKDELFRTGPYLLVLWNDLCSDVLLNILVINIKIKVLANKACPIYIYLYIYMLYMLSRLFLGKYYE